MEDDSVLRLHKNPFDEDFDEEVVLEPSHRCEFCGEALQSSLECLNWNCPSQR